MTTTKRLRVTDACPTRDVLLSCPTEAEWAAYRKSLPKVDMGLVWDGVIAPALDGLVGDDNDGLNMIRTRLDAYAETKAAKRASKDAKKTDLEGARTIPDMDPLGTTDHLGHLASERVHASRAAQTMNEANRKFWKEPASAALLSAMGHLLLEHHRLPIV